MAEFKMPKFVYKDKPIPLDKCYQELADMSYKSPVDVIYQGFQTKLEGDIFEAIQSYGVAVDKDELVKALKYDRDQYRKGFEEGCKCTMDRIKADVAREIFAEIERVIGEKYNHYVFGNNDLDSIGQDAIINFSDTLSDCFTELKKKYTEEPE